MESTKLIGKFNAKQKVESVIKSSNIKIKQDKKWNHCPTKELGSKWSESILRSKAEHLEILSIRKKPAERSFFSYFQKYKLCEQLKWTVVPFGKLTSLSGKIIYSSDFAK